jgi:hypothetical protein
MPAAQQEVRRMGAMSGGQRPPSASVGTNGAGQALESGFFGKHQLNTRAEAVDCPRHRLISITALILPGPRTEVNSQYYHRTHRGHVRVLSGYMTSSCSFATSTRQAHKRRRANGPGARQPAVRANGRRARSWVSRWQVRTSPGPARSAPRDAQRSPGSPCDLPAVPCSIHRRSMPA